MTFITLAERFEQRVAENRFQKRSRTIYDKFPPSSTQPVVIKPDTDTGVFGSNSRIKDDSRELPVVSYARDVRRVSKFLSSPEGKLFLGKQFLLQLGNTFVNTRIYNPLSLVTKVPAIRFSRHAKIPFATAQSGLLQRTTTDIIGNRFTPPGDAPKGLDRVSATGKYLVRRITTNINFTAPGFTTSRPEYIAFRLSGSVYKDDSSGPRLVQNQPLSDRSSRKEIVNFKPGSSKDPLSDAADGRSFVEAAKAFKANFNNSPIGSGTQPRVAKPNRFKSPYFSTENDPGGKTDDDAFYTRNVTPSQLKSSLGDDLNLSSSFTYRVSETPNIGRDRLPGENEPATLPDIITFIFRSGRDDLNKVQFRAFISSIKESVKPEFNEQRYVGRTERFVTYGGVKRSVSLAFNVVAFSPQEMDGMWSKINYLTGLTYPESLRESSQGFMTPPLFNITIGKIYEDHPCYIESLDYEFLDETTTFDVDREVPHVVNVNMQLSLFEKRSRFYNSPFYAITENLRAATATVTTAVTDAGSEQRVNNSDDFDVRVGRKIEDVLRDSIINNTLRRNFFAGRRALPLGDLPSPAGVGRELYQNPIT